VRGIMKQGYPAGTILTCSLDDCGIGLYRIVESASFEDLMVFDDKVLASLNDTISLHDV